MSKIILGIDCSSTTIGWCALEIDDVNIKYIKSGYIKPSKDGSVIERLVSTRKQVISVIEDVKPDYIGIEEIIKFMKGKSTANTIITLTAFNRMIGLMAYDYLKSYPQLFNVLTIRHGLKINNILPKKEDMPELVAQHLGIKFPYKLSSKGKNKGKIQTESYDIADGIAVALYYAFSLTGKIKKRKPKK